MRWSVVTLTLSCTMVVAVACGGDVTELPAVVPSAPEPTATATPGPTQTPAPSPTPSPTATTATTGTATATATPEPSPDPQKYLDTALDLIEEHSIFSDRIDWPAAREEAARRVAGAEDTDGPIAPDETVSSFRRNAPLDDDVVVQAAVARLMTIPGCVGEQVARS